MMPTEEPSEHALVEMIRRPRRQRRAVTVATVAKAAGVSRAAVSFAYNAPTQLSSETRQRILQIAASMGYTPDPVARMLTTRQSGAIGLLMVEPIEAAFADPFTTLFVRGMGQICDRHGLALTLLPPQRGSSIAAAQSAIVDGVIALGLPPAHPAMQALDQRHLPIVVVDGAANDRWSSVQVDDEGGAYQAARHLAAHGHRHVVVLSFDLQPGNDAAAYQAIGREIGRAIYYVPNQRLAGYRRGLPDADLYVVETHSDAESGRQVFGTLLDQCATPPTAVLAMSDALAIGALRACQERGISVPGHCAIIGFDNIPEAATTHPPLTTIAQPVAEKARMAMQFLLRELNAEIRLPHEHIRLATQLVLRESTDPALSDR